MRFVEWAFLKVLREYAMETGNLMSYSIARDKTGLCFQTLGNYFAACQPYITVIEEASGRRVAKVIIKDIPLDELKNT